MATVTALATYRKPQAITHYAYYGDLYGTAAPLNGSGYLFGVEGERKAMLGSYKDADLVLLGRCDLADAKRAEEDAAGGSPPWCVGERSESGAHRAQRRRHGVRACRRGGLAGRIEPGGLHGRLAE